MVTIPIQLRIGGHAPTSGAVMATERSTGGRATKAALTMLAFAGLAAVVFIIPPHLPWVLGSLAAGLFFATRQWQSRYQVQSFEGTCPRCGHGLSMAKGEKVHFPIKLSCYNCHHQPVATAAA